jgi:hypothetical protein
MRRHTLALAAAGLLLLAGCGDSPGYDDATVGAYLVKSQAATFPTAEITKASCPKDRDLREGMTITCTLFVSGASLPYRVKLTHVHSGRVTITAHTDGVLFSRSKLRDFVRTTLPRTASGADVNCSGGAFLVAHVGSSLNCTLTLGSQEKPMKVKVLDDSGRVSIGS